MGLPSIGPGELILILIIALVVLGPGKLPDVASSLGRSVREFRKAATDVSEAGKLDGSASGATSSQPAPAASAAPATSAVPAEPPAPPEPREAGVASGEPARDSNPS